MVAQKGKSIAEQKSFDQATQAMMFEGVSISQLSQIFSQDTRKIKAKIHGLKPVKMRAGHPIYSIAEAAAYLVQPAWPIDLWIQRMNHADLPPLLKKEYWGAMRSRQIYEQAAGDLWPTEKVIEHISEILKTVAVSIRLIPDVVQRESGYTEAQRVLIQTLVDDALANAHKSVTAMLEAQKQEVSGGGSISTMAGEDDDWEL